MSFTFPIAIIYATCILKPLKGTLLVTLPEKMIKKKFTKEMLSTCYLQRPPGGSEWIINVGDYVDNSFTALGSSDPR